MSLDEKKDSSSAFFDDITVFNKSIETDEEAYNLYQEAYAEQQRIMETNIFEATTLAELDSIDISFSLS